MLPTPGTARVPNGVGCAGLPRSLCPRPAACIVCTLRDGRAGSLTPSCAWSSLGGPMPRSIALVLRGRCRPSPDQVPEGASPDRDASGIVTGHLSFLRGEGLLPVLIAPHRRVRRVHGNDRQAVFGRHGHEPGLELREQRRHRRPRVRGEPGGGPTPRAGRAWGGRGAVRGPPSRGRWPGGRGPPVRQARPRAPHPGLPGAIAWDPERAGSDVSLVARPQARAPHCTVPAVRPTGPAPAREGQDARASHSRHCGALWPLPALRESQACAPAANRHCGSPGSR